MTTQSIFYCDSYDEENDYISFVEEKVFEGNLMEKIVTFLQQFGNKDNSIPVEELKNLEMDIYIHNTYEYNARYGVPIAIELYKEIIMNTDVEQAKRIEIYTITLEE